jgi:hypothetical protein
MVSAGGPTSPIKDLPVEFEAAADHADVTGETAAVGPLRTSPKPAAPSRGELPRVGRLERSAAAPEGELHMATNLFQSQQMQRVVKHHVAFVSHAPKSTMS